MQTPKPQTPAKPKKPRTATAKKPTANRPPQKETYAQKLATWLLPENLIRLQGWARDGLTRDQLAEKLGISRATLENWKNKHPQMKEAIKVGRETILYQLENKLITKALNGDTVALIFALKNFGRDRWRDRWDEAVIGRDVKPTPVKINIVAQEDAPDTEDAPLPEKEKAADSA